MVGGQQSWALSPVKPFRLNPAWTVHHHHQLPALTLSANEVQVAERPVRSREQDLVVGQAHQCCSSATALDSGALHTRESIESLTLAQVIRVISQSWKVLLQTEPQFLQHSVAFVMSNSGCLAGSNKRGLAPLARELASSWSTVSRDAPITASTDSSLTGKLIWKQEQNAAGRHCWRNSTIVHLFWALVGPFQGNKC